MFQATTERCAEFLKTGFCVLVYDLVYQKLGEVNLAGSTKPMFIETASAKMRCFLRKDNWKNFNKDCRGVLHYGNQLWVVVGKNPEKDEAICAYLALRFTKVKDRQEWVDLVRSARTIPDFVLLNDAFIKSGQETVLYKEWR